MPLHVPDARRLRARGLLVVVLVAAVAMAGCNVPVGKLTGDRSGPGERALDYVSNAKYTRLVVEIDSVSGSAPTKEALDRLTVALKENTAKGPNVEIRQAGGVPGRGSSHKYTWDEISELEKQNRNDHSGGDTAVLYILFLDGGSVDDTSNGRALGAAYRGSSLVMFKGNIRDSTRPDNTLLGFQATESCLERAVLVHEAGHALGLVNNGLPMQRPHEDASHPKHSSSKDSVMYWAVENTAGLFHAFTGGCSDIPFEFDANDKADLRAARGG